MPHNAFDYSIDPSASWPPRVRPRPPFGPSSVELMRSCPLRVVFEATPGYERRLGFAARIGTAFHRVLQSLTERPVALADEKAAAAEARQRFDRELSAQRAEAASRPREQGLPRDDNRAELAAQACVLEILRIVRSPGSGPEASNRPRLEVPRLRTASQQRQSHGSGRAHTEVEVLVRSGDGLLVGHVDRAEHRPDGTWLFDYKSTLRRDLPESYERQIQLYAFMWHATRSEWPAHSQVLYPLAGTVHDVTVDPAECTAVAAESAELITKLAEAGPQNSLARPGDVCRVCEYRPWCAPFWKWQSSEPSHRAALEKAKLGFTGPVRSITLANHYWHLTIRWRHAEIQFTVPRERLPHLARAQVGTTVRVLDTGLRGLMFQPQAMVTPYTELFLVH